VPDLELIRLISLILSVGFFFLGFFRPVFMPLAYITSLLCKLPHYFPVLIETRYELIIASVGMIRTLFTKNALGRLNFNENKLLMLFLFTVAISFAIAFDQKYSWDLTLYDFVKVLMIYVMVLSSVKSVSDLRIFVWSFIAIFSVISLEPIYQYVTGIGGWQEDYGVVYKTEVGVLSGHVALANNMNQMIPIAYFLLLSLKGRLSKATAFLPLLIFTTALIITKSRGGVIGFTAFIGLLVWYSNNRIQYGFIAAIILIFLFGFSYSFSGTASRISFDSIFGRMGGLFHGVEMLLKGDVFGVGPGCFALARGYYFRYTFASHNLYGELIGDLGIPGTIAWFFLIRQTFLNLRIVRTASPLFNPDSVFLQHLAMGLHISLIVRLILGMGSHGLYYFYWYLVIALSVLLLYFSRMTSAPEGNPAIQ
jgi:hypothetical protein